MTDTLTSLYNCQTPQIPNPKALTLNPTIHLQLQPPSCPRLIEREGGKEAFHANWRPPLPLESEHYQFEDLDLCLHAKARSHGDEFGGDCGGWEGGG